MIYPGLRRTLAGIILGNSATPVSVSNGDVTAAGVEASDAVPLPYTFNIVSGADGTTGVALPAAPAAGQVVGVYNVNGAGNGLNIYPHSGGTINGGTADVAIVTEDLTLAVFICTDGSNWAAIFTVNVT